MLNTRDDLTKIQETEITMTLKGKQILEYLETIQYITVKDMERETNSGL